MRNVNAGVFDKIQRCGLTHIKIFEKFVFKICFFLFSSTKKTIELD